MKDHDKPTVLLEYHLKKLRLPTMLREYASLAKVCRDDRSDFQTYLLRLTERELLDREKRAAERRIKEARFPVIKTIDTFDFKAQPSINEHLVKELMRGEYIDKKENVLLIGNSGTGKTHLACAMAFAACAQGKKVRFHTVTGLVTELLECREERRLQRLQIKVLRLLEDHPMSRLKRAVDRALWSGVNSPDAIAQFLTPAAAWLPTFSLDGREHLCGVKVAGPDISAYGSLLCEGGAP